MRDVLLAAHILVAIVTIGWLAMQSMLVPRAIRDGNAPVVRFANAAAEKIGPLSGLVFLLGLVLVLRRKDDYAEFSHTWVSVSMLLFIVAIVLGAVFINRAEKAALAKIEAGQSAAAEASRVAMLGGINMLLLITIVWLMVDKPGISS
ncbi:MAG TPA: hypothetical protein VNQ77_18615 [Frankiaceae bacterium]|nr:hypothetical protein [Frankiaceae bacterium]